MNISRTFGKRVELHYGGVYGLCNAWGSRSQPKVNWSAYGPVSLSEARYFAGQILKAVKHGEQMKAKERKKR